MTIKIEADDKGLIYILSRNGKVIAKRRTRAQVLRLCKFLS